MRRREIVKGLAAVGVGAATGCGRGSRSGASALWQPPLPGGAFPDSTATPTPTPTPVLSPEELLSTVNTFVVLMMENRSFDHFMGSLKLVEGRAVNGLTGGEWNPAPDGSQVPIFNLMDYTPADPNHDWASSHSQWNGGDNDGFVKMHADSGASIDEVMGYHIRSQIPIHYQLADSYALCDRWHASVMGPTWPNRFYLHLNTSGGLKTNFPLVGKTSIFDLLKNAGVSSRTYFGDLPFQASYGKLDGSVAIEQFFTDAAAGTLQQFSIIDPIYSSAGANDDHPDHDIQLGQALISSIYQALTQSPQWSRTMFILTYDEHGGFFDHVNPPTCWDDYVDFQRMGFRVPSIVAGPMIRKGVVDSTVFEHTSVAATLAKKWSLPMLNARTASSNDLSCLIDPAAVTGTPSMIAAPAPALSPITISEGRIRRLFERGPMSRSQPELQDLADHGDIPRHLDRRAQTGDITRRLLEAGVRVGSVRLTA